MTWQRANVSQLKSYGEAKGLKNYSSPLTHLNQAAIN
jgi:hypothetical protein